MPSLLTCRETLFACLPRRRWSTRVDDLGKESGDRSTLVSAATAGPPSVRVRRRCGGGSVLVAPAPAACLGVVQSATLPQTGALTPLRHATAPTESVRG